MSNFEEVKTFMKTFGQIIRTKPQFPDEKTMRLRYDLIKEELNELLVESGATLIGNLLRESLVDELILYISPKILGNTAKTFSGLTHIQKLSQKINFQINDIIKIDNDLKLHLSRI